MYQKSVDYPDEWGNGYHVMLDSGRLVTVRWEQVDSCPVSSGLFGYKRVWVFPVFPHH